MDAIAGLDKIESKKKYANYTNQKKATGIFRLIINIIVWLFVMFPLIYGFTMAIKPSGELYDMKSIWFPKNPTMENFLDVVRMSPLMGYIKNSLIVATSITLSQIVTSVLAAYAFRFLKFKGRWALYALILSTMMIPGEAVIISQFLMVSRWGLTNSIIVLIIPFIVSAFNIFLAVQAMENFPYEVYEAAKVDGCSDLRFVFTILMPLMKPTLGAMSVQSFLHGWNMYMWPLLVNNTSANRTVQIGISMLKAEEYASVVTVVAGVIVCMIPSLTVFLIGSRNMVKGLTAGAVKG